MSVDYRANLVYGYRIPYVNHQHIPEDWDSFCHYQDSYSEDPYIFFGISLGATEDAIQVEDVSEQQAETLRFVFNYFLPAEAKKCVDTTPKLWLIQEIH